MDRYTVAGLIVFLASAIYAGPVVTTTVSPEAIMVKVEFGPCHITAFDEKYVRASIDSLSNLQCAGKPALPFYPCRVLLPPQSEVEAVAVMGEMDIVPGEHRVKPAPVPIPWFLEQNRGELAKEDDVYRSAGFFPGVEPRWTLTPLAGYQILACNLYPVQYSPTTAEIGYYPELEVKITLRETRQVLKVRSDCEDRVRALVCNPDTAERYRAREYMAVAEKNLPYVIITGRSLLNLNVQHNFEYFKNFLNQRGVGADIVTVEEIYENYPGKDQPEKLRNFIRHAFENWNTRYVLLGGDADKGSEVVPTRRCKTDLRYVYMDGSSINIHEMMACDYYYCALDGDFDANHNGYYGEPEDDIDLEAEVAVGRAPVDNAAQVDNFVRKTVLAYQYADKAPAPKVLMLGEHLFSPGQCGVKRHIYGASFMNELFYGADTHGFHTYGFSGWELGKLYDKEKSWGSSDVLRELGKFGACWVNHIGHSSPGSNMRLSRSSISSLTNELPFLYSSQGCNAARFTNEATVPLQSAADNGDRYDDCISEYLVFSKKGAFAVIANWSYGLSPEDPETSDGDTPGANQYFHRLMVDAFFNPSANHARIGDMLEYAKCKMNPWLLDPKMQTQTVRWVYYQLHLLGDPHAPLPKK